MAGTSDAFQLTDDLLDLVGDAAALGKPPGTDLRSGIYSYGESRPLETTGPADSPVCCDAPNSRRTRRQKPWP